MFILLIKEKPLSRGFTIKELLFVVLIVALFIIFLTPFISKVRDRAKLIACEENLQKIGLGLKLYANENQGKFPETLKELVEGGYVDTGVIDSRYHYITGYTVLSPSDSVIVFDREENHKDGKHVLYTSGEIVWKKK